MGSKRRNDNMSEKTQGEELKEKLFDCKKNGWESTSEEEGRRIFQYCDGYINFLSKSKTEREISFCLYLRSKLCLLALNSHIHLCF